MSKYNPDYPRYHIHGKRVTRHAFITKLHGGEIADAADRGPYWYRDLTIGLDALTVWRKTVWPGGLSLDSVFPAERKETTRRPFNVGDFSTFLERSFAVQSNFDKTSDSISRQYKILLTHTTAELRATRKESKRALRRYVRSVDWSLGLIRKVLAVLYLESVRARATNPERPFDSNERIVKQGLSELSNAFITWFWGNALAGGPRFATDEAYLTSRLGFHGVSMTLVEFQCKALFGLLQQRDAIIEEALPVEYRRVACENILWKVAHGGEVLPWGLEDEAAVEEGLKRGAGNPNWIAEALSQEKVQAISDLADKLLKEDPDKYWPKRPGTIVSTELREEIALQLGVAESTVKRYLEKDPEGWQ